MIIVFRWGPREVRDFVGRAEVQVALMLPSNIHCDLVAEREGNSNNPFSDVRSFVAYFQCPLVPRVGEKFSCAARSTRNRPYLHRAPFRSPIIASRSVAEHVYLHQAQPSTPGY